MTVFVNYFAVVVAAIVNMAIGFFWYGPLFGKQWIALMGWTQEDLKKGQEKMKKEGWKTYVLALIGSLVMAWVLRYVVAFAGAYMNMEGLSLGAITAFWSWLGFVAPITLSGVLWEGKSWKLWLIFNSYYLVALVVMGCIVALWT